MTYSVTVRKVVTMTQVVEVEASTAAEAKRVGVALAEDLGEWNANRHSVGWRALEAFRALDGEGWTECYTITSPRKSGSK